MLAFFGNLAPSEILLLAAIALLVFGRRLPEVASRAYVQLKRWRQSLDRIRRETGIDQEIRTIERNVRDASREARLEPQFPPPAKPKVHDEEKAPVEEESARTIPSSESDEKSEEEARQEP